MTNRRHRPPGIEGNTEERKARGAINSATESQTEAQEQQAHNDEPYYEDDPQWPWVEVTRRQRRPEIRGKLKNQDGNLRVAERTGWLYVGKIHPSMKEENLIEYL